MDSLQTVLSLKKIAADKSRRRKLLEDNSYVGGLLYVLSNADVQIVRASLEALEYLTRIPDHRALFGEEYIKMMITQLKVILKNNESDSITKNLADKLYTALSQTDHLTTPLKDTFNTSSSTSRTGKKNTSASAKNRSLLGNGKSKNINLQLRGMIDRSDRDVVTKLLLQVKGVISITYDLKDPKRKRCFVRTKPENKPETLIQAVSRSQTMTAQQVIKDEDGEEVLLSFGLNVQDMDKENTTLPDYLPDESLSPVHDGKTLARTDQQQTGGKNNGWLSSAASFLTNSFYW